MFKFLQNTFITVLLLCAIIFLAQLIDIRLNTHKNSNKNDIVFIGHSNIQYALNDSLISEKLNTKCINYGTGGQSLFWTVISARKHKLQGINNFIISLDEVTYVTRKASAMVYFNHLAISATRIGINNHASGDSNNVSPKFTCKINAVVKGPFAGYGVNSHTKPGRHPAFFHRSTSDEYFILDISINKQGFEYA